MSEEKEIKKIDIKEFCEKGYLQELNRQFLHPFGLALEIKIDEHSGTYSLNGIWDCRDDPEGIIFGDLSSEDAIQKAKNVSNERKRLRQSRLDILGYEIQPIIERE